MEMSSFWRSPSLPRHASRSRRRTSESAALAAPSLASSWRWTSASALKRWRSPSTWVSLAHCVSLCDLRCFRSSSKSERSRRSSSCLVCSILARSSADAIFTRSSFTSPSAARCTLRASWRLSWTLETLAWYSASFFCCAELSRCDTCCSTDCRRLSRSCKDCFRILSSSLLMAFVISSRISSIFSNCSSRIWSRVFSADSFVSSLLLRSCISCWSLSRASCSSSRESLTFS
mmetsp:Transcript_64220/g.168081  ORF Transcript_64220/g.168081 Transcript_64220/m.168081 type:complete len:232 (+) Transcript_64220:508-1203(+)